MSFLFAEGRAFETELFPVDAVERSEEKAEEKVAPDGVALGVALLVDIDPLVLAGRYR